MPFTILFLSGFIPSLLFFLLRWLTFGGSLVMGIFLAIAYRANPVLYLSFVVAYVFSAVITLFDASKKSFSNYLQFPSSRRNVYQVLANTSLLAVWAFFYIFYEKETIFGAFLGTLAAVLADKSASEIGTLARYPPRMMFSAQEVPPGTSGARSRLGLLAEITISFLLGCFVAFLHAVYFRNSPVSTTFKWIFVASISGVIGSLFDSVLGATLQAQYICSVCQKNTEKTIHCGAPTQLVKGIKWINNQTVNFSAAFVGGLIGLLAVIIWELTVK